MSLYKTEIMLTIEHEQNEWIVSAMPVAGGP